MEDIMLRPVAAAMLAMLCASLPAMAQETGGVRPHGPGSVLRDLRSVERTGCSLSQTSVTVGVNRALGRGSQANQGLGTVAGPDACRPLVSTSVVAGVNLALGQRSGANQSITSSVPRGLLSTNQITRGVNIAAGARSNAGQMLLNQVGP
jgi:hypothetical protein